MTNKTNKKLIILAKGDSKKSTSVAKKPEVVVVKEKILSQEEERDIKAKKRVEELLKNTNLIPTEKKEELFEISPTTESKEGTIWLEEQITLLSSENEALKIELATAKEDYVKIFARSNNSNEFSNETINQNILLLFNELQNNLLGNNPQRTVWTTVSIKHILNQMLAMFPFTAQNKRY